MPKNTWRKYAYLILTLLVTVIAARIFDSRFQAQTEYTLQQQLKMTLDEKFSAFERWSKQLKSHARFVADSEALRLSVVDLLSNTHKQQRSSASNELSDWFSRVSANAPFEDFVLVNKQQVLLATSHNSIVTKPSKVVLEDRFFDAIWRGRSALSLPIQSDIPLKDQKGNTKTGLMSLFVGAPIFDQDRSQIIAALLLRLSPQEFSSIFQLRDIDSPFESYAFNRHSQLISESPFDDQMRKHGILTATESLGHVGVDLPGLEEAFTLRGHGNQQANQFKTTPYVNYRGKSVIGMWQWHAIAGLGIAVEVDANIALQPIHDTRNIIYALTFLLVSMSGAIFFLVTVIGKQRQIQAYFPSLLEAGNEAMLSTDHNGTILYANSRVTELLGYTSKELVNKNIDILIPKALRELHRHHRENFIKNPKQRPMGSGLELHAQHKNGDVVLIEVSLNPFQYRSYTGVTVSMRDVSKQYQLQFELSSYRGRLNQLVKKRTAELEASRRELESYSYTIAHDLRTPLRAITGYSQLLLTPHELQYPDEREDALNRIVQASKRMADMIDDILKLSRITRKDIQFDDVNLSLLVEKSCSLIKLKNPKQKIHFKIEKDLRVRGDRQLLSLVVDNLIENACKYTRLRPISKVEFGAKKFNDSDAFFIRDNGIGFDMAHSNQLFKPFYRLHAEELYEGEGIGLATVQRIIHRHGGRIWAHSEKNIGSTFYFTIPYTYSIDSDNNLKKDSKVASLDIAAGEQN